MDFKAKLKEMLLRHEGLNTKPYLCTEGHLTIGVGRNLEAKGISYSEAMYMLDNDISSVTSQLRSIFHWYDPLDEVRKLVVADMAFNLGVGGLSSFTKMIAAMEREDYGTASDEMLDSRWAGQVGQRAKRLASMMASGEFPEDLH